LAQNLNYTNCEISFRPNVTHGGDCLYNDIGTRVLKLTTL